MLVPLMISSWLYSLPVLIAIVAGLVVVVTLTIPRSTGAARRWLMLAWKIGAWVLAAGALGFAVEALMLAMCDGACRTALSESGRPAPLGIPYALLVAGSVVTAFAIDRAGNALRRRAPSAVSPR